MPPANQTTSCSCLDDAAAAVVLMDTDDVGGWEQAREKFLKDAENAPPVVQECLKSIAEQLTDFKTRPEEERAAIIKGIQLSIQTAAESFWDSVNIGLPKELRTKSEVSISPDEKRGDQARADHPHPPETFSPTIQPPAPSPQSSGDNRPPPGPAPLTEPPMDPLTSTPPASPPLAPRPQGGKYLTFFLAKEEYGFEILKVHEIITLLPVTPVPRMPSHLLGVINLRGKIIPVVDLRLKLGLPPLKEQDCIIIVRAHNIEVGVTVDRVSEVANIGDNDMEEVPSFGEGVTSQDLLGIAKTAGHVRLLLDIDKVLAPDHLRDISGQSLVTTSAVGK